MCDPAADRLRRLADRVANMAEGSGPAAVDPFDALDDPALAALARNPDESAETRRTALARYVERRRTEPDAADLLLAALSDADVALVQAAIDLALPFDPRQIEALRALLDDPRPALRQSAVLALARRKDRAILPRLLAWLGGREVETARLAVTALGWLLAPPERQLVFARAWDTGAGYDREVRLALAEALAGFGDERPADLLLALADDADASQAERARRALARLLEVNDEREPEA
jgi:HEAT repeat protein